MLFVNVITLASLGIIDFVTYKIPNVLLLGWIVTSAFLVNMGGTITITDITSRIGASLLVAGSFIPLRHIVKCNAGDFKLYGVLTVTIGLEKALVVLFITSIMSFFPLANGIKRVQLAFLTFFAYIAFLFFMNGELL